MSEFPSLFCNNEKIQSDKKVCENKDFCNVITSSKDTNIFKFNQYQKFDKDYLLFMPILHMIEKIDGCKNNPENSFATKVSEHILSVFSLSIISSFMSIENKHDVYRGKSCMITFCEYLRENAIKITNFKKKEIKLITTE